MVRLYIFDFEHHMNNQSTTIVSASDRLLNACAILHGGWIYQPPIDKILNFHATLRESSTMCETIKFISRCYRMCQLFGRSDGTKRVR